MTPLVWLNFPLALAFIVAVAGIPLWMTFRRPAGPPDHSEARAYLAAKAAVTADRTQAMPVPGRSATHGPAGPGRSSRIAA